MRARFLLAIILFGCSNPKHHSDAAALPLQFAVLNESGSDATVEFSVNGVVVFDSVVGPAKDVTGLVLHRTLHIKPGTHSFYFKDRGRKSVQRLTFATRPGPMYALVRIRRDAVTLTAGYGILAFM